MFLFLNPALLWSHGGRKINGSSGVDSDAAEGVGGGGGVPFSPLACCLHSTPPNPLTRANLISKFPGWTNISSHGEYSHSLCSCRHIMHVQTDKVSRHAVEHLNWWLMLVYVFSRDGIKLVLSVRSHFSLLSHLYPFFLPLSPPLSSNFSLLESRKFDIGAKLFSQKWSVFWKALGLEFIFIPVLQDLKVYWGTAPE